MVDRPGASPSPLPPRFDVIRELGSGGMGIVYEAFDRELSRRVAAKVFHDRSLDTADRIKREFRVAAAVKHPGLVRLGELFEHDDSLCFSMELIEGPGIAAWVGAPPARCVSGRRTWGFGLCAGCGKKVCRGLTQPNQRAKPFPPHRALHLQVIHGKQFLKTKGLASWRTFSSPRRLKTEIRPSA